MSKISKLNMQWHPVTGAWSVDCPLCSHKTAMTWREGATEYKCPHCQASFTEETLFSYVTIADYFSHPRMRQECLKQAQDNYPQAGRGVIIFDGRAWPEALRTYYLPQAKAEETIGWPDERVEQWVKTYDPTQEVFVYILNNDGSLADWQRLWRGSPGEAEPEAGQSPPGPIASESTVSGSFVPESTASEPDTSEPDASELDDPRADDPKADDPEADDSGADIPEGNAPQPDDPEGDETSWGFAGLVQKGASPAVAYGQLVANLINDPVALRLINSLDDQFLAEARVAWGRQGFAVPPWERARQMRPEKEGPDKMVIDDA